MAGVAAPTEPPSARIVAELRRRIASGELAAGDRVPSTRQLTRDFGVAMATATKGKPTLKIHPLEDRVVILPADEAEAMRGGLYIPDTAKEKPTQGEVIAVGPGRFEKGARVPMELKVGDQVIYGKYSGTPYTVEGDEYVIIKASDVLAKLA